MSEKYNICLMNDSFPPEIDGVANAVVNYARNIEKGLGRAVVVVPDCPDKRDSEYPFPVYRYPSIDLRKATGYMAGVPFSAEIVRRLQKEKVQLLHSHCPITATFLARELRDQIHAPIILTYHTKYDIDIEKAIKSKALQEGSIRVLVENVNACDEVWVVSKGAGENLRSLGYEGDYIVMQNGVDLPKGRMPEAAVEAAVQKYCGPQGLPEDLPVFLFVGRLMWYKGIRISLDALAKLAAEGRDFRFVIIGKGADEEEMKQYAKEIGIGDKCIFTGSIADRNEIRCFYTRCQLFLFPSTFDTNGLVVREASAAGLGSVLVRGSCAAEDVTENKNALLIDENADSMAEVLRLVGWDQKYLRTLGDQACQDLYISWEDAVKKAYDRYGIVLDRWHSGYYPKHTRGTDEFFAFAGDLMDRFGGVQTFREEMEEKAEKRRQETEEKAEKRRQETEEKAAKRRQENKERAELRKAENQELLENVLEKANENIEVLKGKANEGLETLKEMLGGKK